MSVDGRVVGRYQVVRQIGLGAMATVHLARQLDLDRDVALKELARFGVGEDGVFASRFLREARLAGSLSHPNIATVYEYFEHEGQPYIAMEYAEGGSLREHMQGLSPPQIIGVLEGLLTALSHAEGRGIVHRDIKPENILITADGQIKITDFGIAKAYSVLSGGLTATGTTVGTPMYMAPEQATGRPISTATDLYAVGIVAFEMLLGHVPFESGDSALAIIWQHVNEPIPDPRPLRPDLDSRLWLWLEQLLAKDPADRPTSAAAAFDALEEIALEVLGSRWRREAALPVSQGARPARRPLPTTDADVLALERDTRPQATDTRPQATDTGPPATDTRPDTRPTVTIALPPATGTRPPATGTRPPATDTRPTVSRRALRRRSFDEPLHGFAPPIHRPIKIQLTPKFRYPHGPLKPGDAIPMLGNHHYVDRIASPLTNSSGGAMSVSGYSGVGKSTLVRHALDRIQAEEPDVTLIPVEVKVSYPRATVDVLWQIVWLLYEQLSDLGVLDRLEPDLRTRIETAHRRTYQSIKEIQGDVSAQAVGLTAAGSVTASRTSTASHATEGEYLAYSETQVERDLARIITLVARGTRLTRMDGRPIEFLRRNLRKRIWRGHVVVVVDELDKLRRQNGGEQCQRDLITGMKNVIATSGAHFVFVGGEDLHREILEDRHRANRSFYGVFELDSIYIPCIWNAEQRLLDALIANPADRVSPQVGSLREQLAFRGQGMPGRILEELKPLIQPGKNGHHLALTEHSLARAAYYAGLQRLMRALLEDRDDNRSDDARLEEDQWRVACSHAAEDILRRFKVPFSAQDAAKEYSIDAVGLSLALEPAEIAELIDHMVDCRLLREVAGKVGNATYVEDDSEAQIAKYEVVNQIEWSARDTEGAGCREDSRLRRRPIAGAIGQILGNGRYELVEHLRDSSSGSVYRARVIEPEHAGTAGEVAIKLFDSRLHGGRGMRARFERESRLVVGLRHPNIIRTHAAFGEADGRLVLVTDLVIGTSLADVLRQHDAPEARDCVAVAEEILGALDYLHGKGLARLDLTPSGIMLDTQNEIAVVTKLGLAKHVAPGVDPLITRPGIAVGTPVYAAPEQLIGEKVDIRADLYSLAQILVAMIGGRSIRGARFTSAMRAAQEPGVDLSALPASPELRNVMTVALQFDPGARFREPREMLLALRETPEAHSGPSRDAVRRP